MKLYVLPPSPRALKVIALKNYLDLDCEMHLVDLGKGEQLNPEFVAMNPNKKMPVLEDDGFVLWESNAILFYLASKRPQCGLWPSDAKSQADVLRWLAWESAHWDAEACGAVGYEKVSKGVLQAGPPEQAFIARGERNSDRFGTVLNQSLKGRRWLTGSNLTIADFSIGAWVPSARLLRLPIAKFPEITRWYDGIASLPAWQASTVSRPAYAL
jgi:glutathione S-transferase